MKVWILIRQMYCVYPWECVGGGACVCVLMCLHCDIRTERGLSWESQCIQYAYMRTPGAHTVHMYTCTALSNTCAHCAADGWWNSFVSLDSWASFIFFLVWIPHSCLNPPFRTGLSRNGELKGQGGWVGPCWGGDRIKLSWRCFWKVLLWFNRLWESLDRGSLVQDLRGWTVRKTDSITCAHRSPDVLYIHLWLVEVWGETSLKAAAEKGRWRKKRTV